MAPTWREERPDAITAASHSDERPSRSMVTIFSALSSSREVRMRVSNSVGGLALRTGFGAAAFVGAPDFFLDLTAFFTVFLTAFFTAFLLVFFAVFTGLRVRAG